MTGFEPVLQYLSFFSHPQEGIQFRWRSVFQKMFSKGVKGCVGNKSKGCGADIDELLLSRMLRHPAKTKQP